MFNITKAYNSIKTGLVEKHLRRFWFHINPLSEDWKTFEFNCIQFGHISAAALMTIAVEKAAEIFKDVTEDLNLAIKDVKNDSRKLLKDTYIDDGTSGDSRREVERMIGVKLEDGSFSGTIPAMMKKVGLK